MCRLVTGQSVGDKCLVFSGTGGDAGSLAVIWCSVVFVLIYFLVIVLVLVFQLFFSFSFHHFFVLVLVLPNYFLVLVSF